MPIRVKLVRDRCVHEEKEYKTTAKTTKLVDKVALEGLPDQEANIMHAEMPPGWVGGKHYHPGHVFVYVLEGSMTLELEGKDPVTIKAGEIHHEMPNQVMQAKTPVLPRDSNSWSSRWARRVSP